MFRRLFSTVGALIGSPRERRPRTSIECLADAHRSLMSAYHTLDALSRQGQSPHIVKARRQVLVALLTCRYVMRNIATDEGGS